MTEALAWFKRDPAAYLDRWQSITERPVTPYPDGGRLTDEERAAVDAWDYGALYAMGANPFLLWQFARSVSIPEEMETDELISLFREALAPHGYPDFHT